MLETPGSGAERRQHERYAVYLPATLKVISAEASGPFRIWDVIIRDVGQGGFGLSLTSEANVTEEELARMFSSPRSCCVVCQLPGGNPISRLQGQIRWVRPKMTSRGIRIRMGVILEENDVQELSVLYKLIAELSVAVKEMNSAEPQF